MIAPPRPIEDHMWKRQDSETASLTSPADEAPVPNATSVTPPPRNAVAAATSSSGSATLGRSVVITGQVSGGEDLTIDGRVDGTIESRQHTVVIGQQATVKAQIFAKNVTVLGKVVGNITAGSKIEIREQGSVEGDLVSPSVAIAEGATFRGAIDMTQEKAESAA